MAGYSGKPLWKKLGLEGPLTLVTIDAPLEYLSWLGELPAGVLVTGTSCEPPHAVHLFATRRSDLELKLADLRGRLAPGGFVWVSWPKKASKVATDVTEDVIREVALPLGFVDVKVCAVSEIWSGLKLVIRRSQRLGDLKDLSKGRVT